MRITHATAVMSKVSVIRRAVASLFYGRSCIGQRQTGVLTRAIGRIGRLRH